MLVLKELVEVSAVLGVLVRRRGGKMRRAMARASSARAGEVADDEAGSDSGGGGMDRGRCTGSAHGVEAR